jgi:thioredoxin-related protein
VSGLQATQRYGYIEAGTDAPPDLELRYIEQIRDRYYHDVVEGRLIVSEANFRNMGVSSTPTLLLVDRAGIVRSYHPGAMSYDELRRVVERLVKPTW